MKHQMESSDEAMCTVLNHQAMVTALGGWSVYGEAMDIMRNSARD